MYRKESFALRYQDLVSLGRNRQLKVIVKTFDGEVGNVSNEGVSLIVSGISAETKKPFNIAKLWSFKEIFPKVKSVSAIEVEKWPIKSKLIADRRYPNQSLMTTGNRVYVRKNVKKRHSVNKKEGKRG
ncbi:MAG: hypothetical protein LBV67_05650 [Streptococcaceae bacterium]|jgi:hypothetical protein|nr:hypothetical protein [Streptococcaceae bacterium]